MEHLERLGFEVLDRNYRTRWGELDLVAASRDTLVFCEVKARRGPSAFPLESIRHAKAGRVRRMARSWLREHIDRPHPPHLRFDAIGVRVDSSGDLIGLDHLEAAF